jgi:hypothetical protein
VKLLEPPGANVIVTAIASCALVAAIVAATRRLANGRVAAAVDRAR